MMLHTTSSSSFSSTSTSTSTSSSTSKMISSIPLVTYTYASTNRSGDGMEEEESEEEEEVAYRLLELPEEICTLIEQAREKVKGKEKEKARVDEEVGQVLGKRTRRGIDGHNEEEEEEEREHLVINGRHNDEAVLCTKNRTYALREISQSNSLLLCSLELPFGKLTNGGDNNNNNHSDNKEKEREGEKPRLCLRSNVSQLLELIPIVPRLERIEEVLEGSVYEGEVEERRKRRRKKDTMEKVGRRRRYTPHEVRSIVQASDVEIQEGYDEYHVVLLDGEMRLVSPAYLHSLLLSLLLILESNAYLPTEVPLQDTLQALGEDQELRQEVAQALLCRWFGRISRRNEEEEKEKDEGGVEKIMLDGKKIVKFIGEQILKEAKEPIPLEKMMNKWLNQVGDAFKDHVHLDLLRSQYLLHPLPSAKTMQLPHLQLERQIQHFPRSSLPRLPAPRFQALFKARPSWTWHDLEPFLEDLAIDPKRREGLLLRFARPNVLSLSIPTTATVAPTATATATTKGKMSIKGNDKSNVNQEKKTVVFYSARVKY